MPAPTTAMCTSYKSELARAIHNHTATTGNVFKAALYKAVASVAGTHNATETNYSGMGSDELAAGSGYTAGGYAWTAAQNITPATTGTTAYFSWSTSPSWSSATFTTCGFLLYNNTAGGNAVANFYFGGDQSVTAGSFTIGLPTNDSTNAIIRLL